MRKAWSITTTTRNPFRLREQLLVLHEECIGKAWDREQQVRFQVLLIQHRLYGYGDETGFSTQFLNSLSPEHKNIFTDFEHDLTYEEALDIFLSKNYRDPSMRGRQSFNPHKKLGFVYIDSQNILRITSLGEYFLSEDYDLSEIFFRSFLKWQIPNPDSNDYRLEEGYNIKPFLGTLHLIHRVNTLWVELGNEQKGLSKQEFILFVPTLVNYVEVDSYARKIINLRQRQIGKSKREQTEIFSDYSRSFAREFLGEESEQARDNLLDNLRDYGDNAIRYFRFTNLLYVRGGGFHVDLEPRRSIEIKALLEYDDAASEEFGSLQDYQNYLSDISRPILPWETIDKYVEIVDEVLSDIKSKEQELNIISAIPKNNLSGQPEPVKKYLAILRAYRRSLQEKLIHRDAQDATNIIEYANSLDNIYSLDDQPIALERLASLGLHSLNDALDIKPNYPVGDDNEPTFTAPANVPDIEGYYESANLICEVTMLKSRDQYYNEGQPVMRHLRDFENTHSDKPTYCVFIAPSLHRDTVNTYWTAVKYEYEGTKQRIVPLTIANYTKILRTLYEVKNQGGELRYTRLFELYDRIVNKTKTVSSSLAWVEAIPQIIDQWAAELV